MPRLARRRARRALNVLLLLVVLIRVRIQRMRRPIAGRWLRELVRVAERGRRRVRRLLAVLAVVISSVHVVVLPVVLTVRSVAVVPTCERLRVAGRETGRGRVVSMRAGRSGVERVKLMRRQGEVLHLIHLGVDAGCREGGGASNSGSRRDDRSRTLVARADLLGAKGDLTAVNRRVGFERTFLGGGGKREKRAVRRRRDVVAVLVVVRVNRLWERKGTG